MLYVIKRAYHKSITLLCRVNRQTFSIVIVICVCVDFIFCWLECSFATLNFALASFWPKWKCWAYFRLPFYMYHFVSRIMHFIFKCHSLTINCEFHSLFLYIGIFWLPLASTFYTHQYKLFIISLDFLFIAFVTPSAYPFAFRKSKHTPRTMIIAQLTYMSAIWVPPRAFTLEIPIAPNISYHFDG